MKNQKHFLFRLLLLGFIGALIGQSCASTADKTIDQKVSQQPTTVNRADLGKQWEALLDNSKDLNDNQKTQLRGLWQNSKSKTDELAKSSLQLRAVLVKDVMTTPYDETEVNLVKKKIADVEQKRLSIFLDGVHETNHILGRWGSAMERNNFYQWFTVSPDSLSF